MIGPSTPLFDLLDTSVIEIEAEYAPAQLLPLQQALQQRDSESSESQQAESDRRNSESPDATVASMVGEPSLKAVVTLRSGDSELHWPGRPVRLSETVDPATRTLGVVVRVENSSGRINPDAARQNLSPPIVRRGPEQIVAGEAPSGGMRLHPGVYCEVRLWVDVSREMIVLPSSAVTRSTVFVVTDENRLQQRQITVAYAVPEGFAISGGVSEGDQVVLEPPVPAIDGMLARPYTRETFSKGADISMAADQ